MEENMADNNPDNNGMLYFVVGVLVIGLIGLGFYYAGPRDVRGTGDTTIIERTSDRVPDVNIDTTPDNNTVTPNTDTNNR
jgi:hypothetical protein